MEAVQSLYEKKLVTYPRTDARVLTTAISREISKNLQGLKNIPGLEKATEYALSQNPESIGRTKYTDDKQVSDHYAIIPTGEGMLQELSSLERSVYMMIASRFVSVFQPPAEFEKITCTFVNGKETYTCSTKYMTSAGFWSYITKVTQMTAFLRRWIASRKAWNTKLNIVSQKEKRRRLKDIRRVV